MEEIKERIKELKDSDEIGEGKFGKVYKLEFNEKEYAIKIISKDEIDNNADENEANYLKKALRREVAIQKTMSKFENSVKIYEFYEEDDYYIIVLELCDTDLNKLLESKGKFTSLEILDILEGLNKPFEYMHNNGIIHRDIKPENIMIKYPKLSHNHSPIYFCFF